MASHKFSCSPNMNSRLTAYRDAHDGMSTQDAIRELISMGLSSSPMDDATLVAKQRGFDSVRRWTMTQVAQAFEELATKAREQIGDFKREKRA